MAILATKQKSKILKKCLSCQCEKSIDDYYVSNNKLHADGLIPWCIDCVKDMSTKETGEIDEEKFEEILRQIDRPYYKDVLASAEVEHAKRNKDIPQAAVKFYGESIIGWYFKSINISQNKDKTYGDSVKSGFYRNPENASITKNNQKQSVESYDSDENSYSQNETDDATIYSEVWMGNYTQKDIQYLDKYYAGLQRDYKIITENHRDYARKIAKASLQMDKAFDDMINGVNGADAKYKNAKDAFDTLSKSAKFSESTRSVNDVGISSFSKVAAMVEAHNWIPEHKPLKKDVIDEMIDYLSTITKSL